MIEHRHSAWFRFAALGLVLGASAGCATIPDANRRNMEEREDMLIIREDIRKLAGRIEGVELEVQRLQAELDSRRSGQDQALAAQTQALQGSLAGLEGRLRTLEATRDKDKQELLDRLSAKMADILKASAAPAARPQPSGRRAASGVGYEHEVKAGETLSAIATAYGAKMSAILDANGLKNADQLRVGQKLMIPQ